MTILQRQLRASDGKCIYTVAHNTHIREEVQSCSEVCMHGRVSSMWSALFYGRTLKQKGFEVFCKNKFYHNA
jgi:hypothetical protein